MSDAVRTFLEITDKLVASYDMPFKQVQQSLTPKEFDIYLRMRPIVELIRLHPEYRMEIWCIAAMRRCIEQTNHILENSDG